MLNESSSLFSDSNCYILIFDKKNDILLIDEST